MMTYNYVWLSLHPLVAIVMSEIREEVKAVELSMRGEEFGLDGLMMMVLSSFDSWLVVNLWHKQCFMFTTMPFLLTFQVCANCSLDYVSVIVILIVKFLLFLFLFKSQTHSPPIRLADVWEWLLQPNELSAQVMQSSLLQYGLLVAQLCLTLNADQEDGVIFSSQLFALPVIVLLYMLSKLSWVM